MAKLDYKILKNMPYTNSYGQYYHTDNLELFFDGTGIRTPFRDDDLYTIVTDSGYYNENTFNHADFKPISNAYVGNNPDTGTFLQKYYEFSDQEYYLTSAPNITYLYFDIAYNDNSYDINYYDDIQNYGTSSFLNQLENNQNLYIKIINWDCKEGEDDEITEGN